MSGPGLDALAAQADALGADGADDTQAGGSMPAAPAAPVQSANYAGIAFLLAGGRELACMLLKVESPRRTLDDAKVEACAAVLAPVADKYGVNLGGFMDGPEGAALVTAGPILWTVWRELDAELRARRAAEAKPEAPQVEGPRDDGT